MHGGYYGTMIIDIINKLNDKAEQRKTNNLIQKCKESLTRLEVLTFELNEVNKLRSNLIKEQRY